MFRWHFLYPANLAYPAIQIRTLPSNEDLLHNLLKSNLIVPGYLDISLITKFTFKLLVNASTFVISQTFTVLRVYKS